MPGLRGEEVEEQMYLFAEQVMPELRRACGGSPSCRNPPSSWCRTSRCGRKESGGPRRVPELSPCHRTRQKAGDYAKPSHGSRPLRLEYATCRSHTPTGAIVFALNDMLYAIMQRIRYPWPAMRRNPCRCDRSAAIDVTWACEQLPRGSLPSRRLGCPAFAQRWPQG